MFKLIRLQASFLLPAVLLLHVQSCTEKPVENSDFPSGDTQVSPQQSQDSSDESSQKKGHSDESANSKSPTADSESNLNSAQVTTLLNLDKENFLLSLKIESQQLTDQNNKLHSDIKVIDDDFNNNSRDYDDSKKQRLATEAQLSGLNNELGVATQVHQKLIHDVGQIGHAIDAREASLEKIRTKLAAERATLFASSSHAPGPVSTNTLMIPTVALRSNANIAELEKLQAYEKNTVSTYRSQVATLEVEVIAASRFIAELNNDIRSKQGRLDSFVDQCTALESKMQHAEPKRLALNQQITANTSRLTEIDAMITDINSGKMVDDPSLTGLNGFWTSQKFIHRGQICQTLLSIRSKGRSVVRTTQCDGGLSQYDAFAVTVSNIGIGRDNLIGRPVPLTLASSSCPAAVTSAWPASLTMNLAEISNSGVGILSGPSAVLGSQMTYTSEGAVNTPKSCEELATMTSTPDVEILADKACFERQQAHHGCLSI